MVAGFFREAYQEADTVKRKRVACESYIALAYARINDIHSN